MPTIPRHPYLTCFGLPLASYNLTPIAHMIGKTEIGADTLMSVDTFTVPLKGITIRPCYLNIRRMSENEFAVIGYGLQTHLMTPISERAAS